MEPIVNKIAESGLVTIDLKTFLPETEIAVFDLKDFLFMGMILKEKDFRQALKNEDWTKFSGKYVAVTCSADAIIPMWAYMLVATCLKEIAKAVYFGNAGLCSSIITLRNIEATDFSVYTDKRVLVKGCGEHHIPEQAYIAVTNALLPHVKSVMYGEACSSVPVFKRK